MVRSEAVSLDQPLSLLLCSPCLSATAGPVAALPTGACGRAYERVGLTLAVDAPRPATFAVVACFLLSAEDAPVATPPTDSDLGGLVGGDPLVCCGMHKSCPTSAVIYAVVVQLSPGAAVPAVLCHLRELHTCSVMNSSPTDRRSGTERSQPHAGSSVAPDKSSRADVHRSGGGIVASPPATKAACPRRSVKVADLDKLSCEMQAMKMRCDAVDSGMEATKNAMATARLPLNGIRALQQVALQEQFPLGRSLQRRLATRLVERLKARPPSGLNRSRGGASQPDNRIKAVLSFDADADRRSMDELMKMLSLSYTILGPARRERAAQLVEFTSPALALTAFGMSESLWSWAMARFTRRSDGSTPSRVRVERLEDDDGSMWFILQRRMDGDVHVATRKTEEFDPQRRRFVHPLERTTSSFVELSGLPASCPAFLRWRPADVAAMMGHEEGLACGKVTLSLPCCVLELDAQEVLDVIQ